jgi:hypothetical protein
MSPIYVPGKVVLAQTYVGIDDPDAAVYIAAVEAADEAESPGIGALETATKVAIHSFVKGCKADGIWPAIKASCILAGARTLTGALVPLVGAAPTNFNFAAGDYNRKTGLVGDGSMKYLNSNRNNNADPQNNNHVSVFATELGAAGRWINTEDLTVASGINTIAYASATSNFNLRMRSSPAAVGVGSAVASKLVGMSRSNSAAFTLRSNSISSSTSQTSDGLASGNTWLYRGGGAYSSPRLAFYSIGESLDLALLDARVTNLINAIGAAF